MAFEYTKQPWEEEIIAVDFSRRVASSVTVDAVATGVTDVTVEETVSMSGLIASNYSPHLSLGIPALTGVTGKEKILAVMVSAGVSGFKYRLSFRVTLSDSQKKEDDVWVIVKES
jgi:hypothetical protein